MKLSNIIQEIQINRPLSKKQILQYIINEGMYNYLEMYESMEELLDEMELEDPKDLEIAKQFYSSFKKNEVYFVYHNTEYGGGSYTLPQAYKNFVIVSNEKNTVNIIFHNLGEMKVQ